MTESTTDRESIPNRREHLGRRLLEHAERHGFVVAMNTTDEVLTSMPASWTARIECPPDVTYQTSCVGLLLYNNEQELTVEWEQLEPEDDMSTLETFYGPLSGAHSLVQKAIQDVRKHEKLKPLPTRLSGEGVKPESILSKWFERLHRREALLRKLRTYLEPIDNALGGLPVHEKLARHGLRLFRRFDFGGAGDQSLTRTTYLLLPTGNKQRNAVLKYNTPDEGVHAWIEIDVIRDNGVSVRMREMLLDTASGGRMGERVTALLETMHTCQGGAVEFEHQIPVLALLLHSINRGKKERLARKEASEQKGSERRKRREAQMHQERVVAPRRPARVNVEASYAPAVAYLLDPK